MVTFNLLAYIKRERGKGTLLNKITESLVSNGWAMIDIVSAYRQLKINVPIDIDIKFNNANLQEEKQAEALLPLTPYLFSAKKPENRNILKVIFLILFFAVFIIIFLKFLK